MATATRGDVNDLHRIKSLFLRRQYRQTITACQSLLKGLVGEDVQSQSYETALYKSFCLFYLAAAHDDLAWAMHRNSPGKLPAFTTAQLFYQQALDALPAEQHILNAHRTSSPVTDLANASSLQDNTPKGHRYMPSFSDPAAHFPKPPTYTHTSSISRPQSRVSIPRSISEKDEFEDFDQDYSIPRTLPREYSRISLLESATSPSPPASSSGRGHYRRHLTTSGSSTASSPIYDRRANLPKIVTQARVDSGLPSASSSRFVSPEPVYTEAEPVSPLSPNDDWDNEDDTSPVSPERASFLDMPWSPTVYNPPTHQAPRDELDDHGEDDDDDESLLEKPYSDTAYEHHEHHENIARSDHNPDTASNDDNFQDSHQDLPESDALSASDPTSHLPSRTPDHLITQLASFRTQLDSHMALVQTQLSRIRTEKARIAAAAAENDHNSDGNSAGDESSATRPKAMQQARSYWSFTPEQVKVQELQCRVREGKERMWVRERFCADRYEDLADMALAEL